MTDISGSEQRTDSTTMEALFESGTGLTRLGSGYQFTEGPVWSPTRAVPHFSDIPGDARWRWIESGRAWQVVMQPSFKANGLRARSRRVS